MLIRSIKLKQHYFCQAFFSQRPILSLKIWKLGDYAQNVVSGKSGFAIQRGKSSKCTTARNPQRIINVSSLSDTSVLWALAFGTNCKPKRGAENALLILERHSGKATRCLASPLLLGRSSAVFGLAPKHATLWNDRLLSHKCLDGKNK